MDLFGGFLPRRTYRLRTGSRPASRIFTALMKSTKYRHQVFDGDAFDRLRLLFTKICTDFESERTGEGWRRPSCPLAGSLSTEGGHLEPGSTLSRAFPVARSGRSDLT